MAMKILLSDYIPAKISKITGNISQWLSDTIIHWILMKIISHRLPAPAERVLARIKTQRGGRRGVVVVVVSGEVETGVGVAFEPHVHARPVGVPILLGDAEQKADDVHGELDGELLLEVEAMAVV